MKIKNFYLLPLLFLSISCSKSSDSNLSTNMYQIARFDTFAVGGYDGIAPLSYPLSFGGFGIGTVDGLNGELTVLDGAPYLFTADGKIIKQNTTETTPFIMFCAFSSDKLLTVKESENLYEIIDQSYPDKTQMLAIRAKGSFTTLKNRSVPKQSKPYLPLSEIVPDKQIVFDTVNVKGTLVGFRLPQSISGVNIPGYHSHFLSEDKLFGGHILEFHNGTLEVEIQVLDSIRILKTK